MTGDRVVLLFVDADGAAEGWLRLADSGVVARGAGDPPPPEAGTDERIALIVPGEAVAIRWAELPGLADAQARAAARLLAADVSATPVDRLHVAAGAEDADGLRPIALVDQALMAAWLADAQARGLDPDCVIPDPLLIVAPEAGARRWLRGDRALLRGPTLALAADRALADLALAEAGDGAPVETLDDAAIEAGLARALGAPAIDLRQGEFAQRRRWPIDRAAVRRMAALAGLILLVLLATDLARLLRHDTAAGRAEREIAALAAGPAAPAGGAGFMTSAAILFAAVRDTPDTELSALDYAPDSSLRATVMAADAAAIAALAQRIEAAGLAVEQGPARPGGGRQIADLVVRRR